MKNNLLTVSIIAALGCAPVYGTAPEKKSIKSLVSKRVLNMLEAGYEATLMVAFATGVYFLGSKAGNNMKVVAETSFGKPGTKQMDDLFGAIGGKALAPLLGVSLGYLYEKLSGQDELLVSEGTDAVDLLTQPGKDKAE